MTEFLNKRLACKMRRGGKSPETNENITKLEEKLLSDHVFILGKENILLQEAKFGK